MTRAFALVAVVLVLVGCASARPRPPSTYRLGAQTCQSYQSIYVHASGLIECR